MRRPLSAAIALSACLLSATVWGQEAPASLHVSSFTVQTAGGVEKGVAMWPRKRPDARRWPVLVALHGMGEAKLGPAKGYLAWPERYGLLEMLAALLSPPLSARTLGGLVREGELSRINQELASRAFEGLFVVGVYTPDLLSGESQAERLDAYARFLAEVLLPRVHDVFPVTDPAPGLAGIDGVSLGGMVALEVAVRRPEVFASVGALQPAVRGRERALAKRLQAASRAHPFALRLASSDEDPFLPVVRKLSEELRSRAVGHTLVVTPGGHNYTYNRGPGALELVRFHEQALGQAQHRKRAATTR